MAQQRRHAAPRPEEALVSRVLADIFDGASVVQYDDGSEDGMYDLRLSGPFDAAIEVGRVTDQKIRSANGHWRNALQPHKTHDLKCLWTFMFADHSAPGAPANFPWVPRPGVADLTDILQRLETRGKRQIGRVMDYLVSEPDGLRISDPEVAALCELLGPAAEHASAVDVSHRGEPGGWRFVFGYGHVSTTGPDQFARHVEGLLYHDERLDMRAKLDRSCLPTRIAALVFDSTGGGWATGHLASDNAPTVPIELPAEVTHVLVVGMNDLTLLFTPRDGWSKYSTNS